MWVGMGKGKDPHPQHPPPHSTLNPHPHPDRVVKWWRKRLDTSLYSSFHSLPLSLPLLLPGPSHLSPLPSRQPTPCCRGEAHLKRAIFCPASLNKARQRWGASARPGGCPERTPRHSWYKSPGPVGGCADHSYVLHPVCVCLFFLPFASMLCL